MKKFHWGHGIALVYTLFAAALVVALIASRKVDRSLVRDDYYALDLSYQERYDKMQNAKDKKWLEVQKNELGGLEFRFKSEKTPQGTIYFYRASDQSKDFKLDIQERLITVPAEVLLNGKWTVKVDWTDGDLEFYEEKTLYL